MSEPLPKHEVAQLAATCHIVTEDDELRAQIKTWCNIEAYATRLNVSGRSKEDKRALEQLEKTTNMIDGRVNLHYLEHGTMQPFKKFYFSAHS